MAGIYLHIPFCSEKCHYCDFYSVVSYKRKDEFVQALLSEIEQRSNYLKDEKVKTIYFGGGTPSLLSLTDLESILNTLFKTFSFEDTPEITLEANPEGASETYLKGLKKLGINRLSMGVQSFSDKDLKFLKRTHSASQAIGAVKMAQDMGLDNMSLDLIYGLPSSDEATWAFNLETFFSLNVNHLSAYHLTYEVGTVLYKKMQQKKVIPVLEQSSVQQFQMLMDAVHGHHYEMYEISNFARNEAYSKHNLSYWQQKAYLGLGPSAHSFNLSSREWNVSSLAKYIKGIQEGERFFEIESLEQIDLINEYLITRLRTKWGLSQDIVETRFGKEVWDYFVKQSEKYAQEGLLIISDKAIRLSPKGVLISDAILENLFLMK